MASNIVGLVLFHEHDHGGHHHSHGEEPSLPVRTENLEAGGPSPAQITPSSSIEDIGTISDILPEAIVRRASQSRARVNSFGRSPTRTKFQKRASRTSFASADDIYVSPAANRRSILTQAQEIQSLAHDSDEFEEEDGYNGDTFMTQAVGHKRTLSIPHDQHNHAKPKERKAHSHQNLNMRGVFLHVLGDALGNVGVIATALFIWLTDFSWRYYSDPVISLVITGIIFSSALPLVKSASLILLQGVPRGISLDDVKEDILQASHPCHFC